MKDLTVSIVAFNDEEDVLNAVSSIEEHTPSLIAKTIYIIDNSDKPNNLDSLLKKFDDVEYIRIRIRASAQVTIKFLISSIPNIMP